MVPLAIVNFHILLYISQKKWRDFGTPVQLLAYEWSVVLLSSLGRKKRNNNTLNKQYVLTEQVFLNLLQAINPAK